MWIRYIISLTQKNQNCLHFLFGPLTHDYEIK